MWILCKHRNKPSGSTDGGIALSDEKHSAVHEVNNRLSRPTKNQTLNK